MRENDLALFRAEMRTFSSNHLVRQMCGVKLFDRVACEELRDRLGLEDVVTVLQRNRLRGYSRAVVR